MSARVPQHLPIRPASDVAAPAPFDLAALLAASVTALLTVVSFSYPLLLEQESGAVTLASSTAALLYAGGLLFGAGMIAAVAGRRTALAVNMFFCYLFYFIAVREQIYGRFDTVLANRKIVETSLLICLVFGFILLIVNAMPIARRAAPDRAAATTRAPATLVLVLLSCCALQLVFVAHLGSTLLSSRGEMGQSLTDTFGKAVAALTFNFVFSFMFFLPLTALLGHRPDRLDLVRALALLSFLLACFLNNPLVHPRFYVGALAVGTFMLVANPCRSGLALLVIAGSTLVAPLLNVFRDMWAWQNVDPQLGLAALRTFDFDAFTSVCYGLIYIQEYDFLYGSNILGSLLFFVPSAAWPGKPEYTGGMLYEAVIQRYRLVSPDNLSAPIPIEGYLAFGWAGVVALSLVFAFAVRWLDATPRATNRRDRCLSAQAMCLAFSPVLLMFLQRGSLMPTFAYSFGMVLAATLSVHLIRAAGGAGRLPVGDPTVTMASGRPEHHASSYRAARHPRRRV